jgi:hypothetical protein
MKRNILIALPPREDPVAEAIEPATAGAENPSEKIGKAPPTDPPAQAAIGAGEEAPF